MFYTIITQSNDWIPFHIAFLTFNRQEAVYHNSDWLKSQECLEWFVMTIYLYTLIILVSQRMMGNEVYDQCCVSSSLSPLSITSTQNAYKVNCTVNIYNYNLFRSIPICFHHKYTHKLTLVQQQHHKKHSTNHPLQQAEFTKHPALSLSLALSFLCS